MSIVSSLLCGSFDEELAKEAHEILDGWKSRKLSEEETEALERLVNLEKIHILI